MDLGLGGDDDGEAQQGNFAKQAELRLAAMTALRIGCLILPGCLRAAVSCRRSDGSAKGQEPLVLRYCDCT